MNSARIYDLGYLKELAAGDEDFVIEMVEYFVEHALEVLNSCENELKNQNWKALRELVHKFSPNLNLMGLTEAVKMANRVEYLSENQIELTEISTLLVAINEMVITSVNQLKLDFKIN